MQSTYNFHSDEWTKDISGTFKTTMCPTYINQISNLFLHYHGMEVGSYNYTN
jgi:hypothetical protein